MISPELTHIEGPNLVLRLIRPDDAEYVHGLRTDRTYNRFLSPVAGSAADQRRWLESYKAREERLEELYYVVERPDGVSCGLVRLYDIDPDSFTWGSWILDGNKPRKAALESAVLSFGVGFQLLDLPQAKVDVRAENRHAEAFYRRFGMTETSRDARDIFFVYPRWRYIADLAGHMAVLRAEA